MPELYALSEDGEHMFCRPIVYIEGHRVRILCRSYSIHIWQVDTTGFKTKTKVKELVKKLFCRVEGAAGASWLDQLVWLIRGHRCDQDLSRFLTQARKANPGGTLSFHDIDELGFPAVGLPATELR